MASTTVTRLHTFYAGVAGRPEPWILGATPVSAFVAARFGMRYCFAAFLNPAEA